MYFLQLLISSFNFWQTVHLTVKFRGVSYFFRLVQLKYFPFDAQFSTDLFSLELRKQSADESTCTIFLYLVCVPFFQQLTFSEYWRHCNRRVLILASLCNHRSVCLDVPWGQVFFTFCLKIPQSQSIMCEHPVFCWDAVGAQFCLSVSITRFFCKLQLFYLQVQKQVFYSVAGIDQFLV